MAKPARPTRGRGGSEAAKTFLADGTNTNRKAGITVGILNNFRLCLGARLHTEQGACLWAAFLTAFFGLLRKANVACVTQGQHPDSARQDSYPADFRQPPARLAPVVRRQDLERRPDGSYMLTLPCTKTRQPGSGRPQLRIPLPRITSELHDTASGGVATHALCPGQALDTYVGLTQGRPPSEPLFGWRDARTGTWKRLTYAVLVTEMKGLLQQCGEDPTLFGGQSFRRGGASFAHNTAGLPTLYIKALGDWLSDAFQIYIEVDEGIREVAQQRVSAAVRRSLPS